MRLVENSLMLSVGTNIQGEMSASGSLKCCVSLASNIPRQRAGGVVEFR